MLLSLGFTLVIFAVVLAVVLGLGLGLGWILHWVLPQIDLGLSLVIGMIAGVASLNFAARLVTSFNKAQEETELEEYLRDPDEPPAVIRIIESAGVRRERRRKKVRR